MSKPKILYALQGTGNGHVARAVALLPELQKHFDVDVLIAGNQTEVKLPIQPKWQLKGLVFYYTSKGGIDYWTTLRKLQLFRFLWDISRLPVRDYQYVLNDFEAITAYACKFKKVPCISISHQAGVLSPQAPMPVKKDVLGLWILKNYAPTPQYLGFHFKKWGNFVMGPVVRPEIMQAQPTDEGFYLVYLPAYSKTAIQDFLMQFPKSKFYVFHKSIVAAESEENIHWAPINGEEFMNRLVRCSGVLTSAGFETPAETLYLKKKLLVVPIKGQFEQACNAAGLRELGIPVMEDLDFYEVAKWILNPQKKLKMEITHPALVVERLKVMMSKN
jgi:uncharacterized protein (TIGR00661 family)